MEADTGGYADTDERRRSGSASAFAWPPSEGSGLTTEVVDFAAGEILRLDDAAAAAAEARGTPAAGWATPSDAPRPAAPGRGIRDEQPDTTSAPSIDEPGSRLRARRQPSRALLALLAALVVAEGVAIALQMNGREIAAPLLAIVGDATRGIADPPRRVPSNDIFLPAASALPASAPAAPHVAPGGELRVRTDPPGAVISIDGRKHGVAPLTIESLPPGPHQIRLVAGESSIEEKIIVEPGGATSLVVRMPPRAAATGWVQVVMPFEVHVFEDGRLVGTSAHSPLEFKPGQHRLVLTSEAIGYKGRSTVRVRAGAIAKLQPDVPTGLLHANALPWAEVWIDGRPAGTTPLGNVRLPLGAHELRFRHPDLGEQTRRVMVTAHEPVRIGVEFKR